VPSSAIAAFARLVEARPPEPPSIWFDTACVLGGSIAGLLAARVLADHARRVVVVERDVVNIDGRSRAGVPQDRQVHVLLPGGRRWLEHWLPGLTRDLQDRGAVLSGPGQFVQYTDGRPQIHEHPLLTASRPLLESRIRARVLALPNVSTRQSQVTGLEYRDGRVTAVRHRSGQAAHVLSADFVVDAMGRASRLADWLDRDGYDIPPLQRLATSINYASALFKRTQPHALTAAVALFSPPYPVDQVAVGGIGAIEADQWLVLLMGYDDSRPGRTLEAFQDTCAKLPPVFAEATRDAVTGEIFTYHQADSRRRDFAGLPTSPRACSASAMPSPRSTRSTRRACPRPHCTPRAWRNTCAPNPCPAARPPRSTSWSGSWSTPRGPSPRAATPPASMPSPAPRSRRTSAASAGPWTS
jgi:2-polyprenyl-6-methoxyphenol hydroxylase-like FAD-dependent oxidoreductase